MFEDLVSNLLSTYLGDYLEGLTKDDLKISLWKGDVELRNLRVRTEALDFLNLPIQVKDGFVGKLTLKIPWKNLGKKPTKAIEENELRYDEEMNAKQNNSSTAKLLAKIIDNFQLRIDQIHIRFEDHSSCKDRSFCAGIILEKLHVDSPHSESDEKNSVIPGVIDKKVKLSRLGIYWDSNQPSSSVQDLQHLMEIPFVKECSPSLLPFCPQHFILEPVSLELQIHIDLRKVELRKPPVEEVVHAAIEQLGWEQDLPVKKLMKCYTEIRQDGVRGRTKQEEWQLLHPRLISKYSSFCTPTFIKQASLFCETCWEIGNTPAPMVVVSGEMKEFLIKLEHQQYLDILEFLTSLSVQTLKAKYRRFKPESLDICSHPREWWKFAIQSVIADNQNRRKNSGWDEYLRFKKHREEYIELYKRKVSSKNGLKKDTKALARLQKLEDSFALENTLLFRKIAMQEMTESAEKQKKKTLFKKTRDSEEVFEWTEEKRNELFTEFDINPEETSPWEGGRPKDIQIRVDFHLRRMGLYLLKEETKILACKLASLCGRFLKRKEYVQLWCGLDSLGVEDSSAENDNWKHLVYAEKDAIIDKSRMTRFLPDDMLSSESLPFLQLAVELPSMTEDADVSIRCTTLPLCLVGNVVSVMRVADFFFQDVSNVNLYGFKNEKVKTMKLQEYEKIQKMKVTKEIKSHKLIALDVLMGSVHLILPEQCTHSPDQTQSLVFRLGDLSIHSHPQRVSVDDPISEANVYDIIEVNVSSMNAIITNYQQRWMRPEVQKEYHLTLLDDFYLKASVGKSIAPSNTQFPSFKVNVELSRLYACINQKQYEGILQWLRGFIENVVSVVDGSKDNLNELTVAANHVVSQIVKKKPKEKTQQDEENVTQQQKCIFDMNVHFQGVRIRCDETCNEDAIVELSLDDVIVAMKKHTFEMSVECSLQSFMVEDCIRSRLSQEKCYLIRSQKILQDGCYDQTTEQKLVKVSLIVLGENSPNYTTCESARMLTIAMGSVSVLVYRPTVCRFIQFILPNELASEPLPRSSGRDSGVSIHTIAYIKRLTKQLLSYKHKGSIDWLRKKLLIKLSLQSVSALLLTDHFEYLYYALIDTVSIHFGICPAMIEIHCSLNDVYVKDCSRGAGVNPSILSIVDKKSHESFIILTFRLYTNMNYPRFPGYKLGLEGHIKAPSLNLRRRCIDEILKYLIIGPLAEAFAVIKRLKTASKKPSILSLLYSSALQFSQTLFIQNANEKLPVLLPRIHLTISNCVVTIPVDSDSLESIVLELGQVDVSNKQPVTIEENDRLVVQVDSLKETLNTVSLQLTKMCAYTQTGVSSQSLMGSISCSLECVVSQTLEIMGHASKVSLAINDNQLFLLIHLLKGNLSERAVCCEGELKRKLSKKPSLASRVYQSFREDEYRFGQKVSFSVLFDGICLEYLLKDGGYPVSLSGEEMTQQVGTHKLSFFFMDVNHLHCFARMKGREVSLGVSLSSVSVQDSRKDSGIHQDYCQPLLFGGESKPAVSIVLSLRQKHGGEYRGLIEEGVSADEVITDVQLSILIGNLQVLLTPWIFAVLNQVESITEEFKDSITPIITHSSPSVKTKPKGLLPNFLVDVRVDNPYIYLIEDTTINTSPAFLVSLSMDASVSLSPLLNLNMAVSILNIRGCRANPSMHTLPEPSMLDAIQTFDINSNLHLSDHFSVIRGTISTSSVNIRVGIKDIRLWMNAISNLIPADIKHSKKVETDVISTDSSTSSFSRFAQVTSFGVFGKSSSREVSEDHSTSFKHQITFFISLNQVSVIVVNDTTNAEIPVLQCAVDSTYGRIEMTSDWMLVSTDFSWSADYYDPSLSVWEPVLEKWQLQFKLEREPRGRILQKLSASSKAKMKIENAITHISITSPSMLDLNVPSKMISVILQTVYSFKECHSTVHQQGDNYYISISNSTGIDGTYQIVDDGGLNEFLFEKQIGNTDVIDEPFFSGVSEVAVEESIETCWIELHHLPPMIRVFTSIPFSRDSDKYILFGDGVVLNGEEPPSRQAFTFVNHSSIHPEKTVSILLHDQRERDVWKQYAKQMECKPEPFSFQPCDELDYCEKDLPGNGETVVTSIPAHPSLAYHYLAKPFRRTRDRLVSIELKGFQPFCYNIDCSIPQSVRIHTDAGESLPILLQTTVISGLKQLIISSPVRIVNQTHGVLRCGFYEEIDSLKEELVQAGDCLWAPYVCLAGGLFIRGEETKYLNMSYILTERGSGLMNIGTASHPHYIVVYEEVKEITNLNSKETVKEYSLIISNVLELKNLLPEPIEYHIIDQERVYEDGAIRPGESRMITSCKFKKNEGLRVSIRLMNEDYEFSEYENSIFTDSTNNVCTLVNQETGYSLALRYLFFCNDYNAWSVQLYSDYWIINKTGDSLIIRDELDETNMCLVPSEPLSWKVASQTHCQDEPLLHPSLFGIGRMNQKVSIQVTQEGCLWSDAFSINTHGMTGQCCISKEGETKREHMYAVSITRAPGIFAHTLVVSFSPLYTLINQMSIPVKVKQQDSYEKMVLSPGGYAAYSWASSEKPHKMEINLEYVNYGWSRPFPLQQGHFCLQLVSPQMSVSNHSPHEFLSTPDVVQQPYSAIQIDITCVKSQFYVFIKNANPAFMPFCVSNDCFTDIFTIRQRGASWKTSLQLQPLTSFMWTLPEVEGEEQIDIYHQSVGSLPSSSMIRPVLSIRLDSPGLLGVIEIPQPSHKVNVRLLIEKTNRVIVFERVNEERLSFTSLIQDKFELIHISEEVDSTINSLSLVSTQVSNQESTPLFTYIRFLYVFDAYLSNPLITSASIGYHTDSSDGYTDAVYDSSLYFGYEIITEAGQLIQLTLHLTTESFQTITGHATLDSSVYTSIEKVYKVVVPFFSDTNQPIGCLLLHLLHTPYGQIAHLDYQRCCLLEIQSTIQEILPRVDIECRLQKSIDSYARTERHLLRATHTGMYRQSSINTLTDSDSIHDGDIEGNLNFCVILHSLSHLPIEKAFSPLYCVVEVGNYSLRTPSTTAYRMSTPTNEVILSVSSASFGCSFDLRDGQLLVTNVQHNSVGAKAGIDVGFIVKTVDHVIPSSLSDFLQKLNHGTSEKEIVLSPPTSGLSQELVFDQELVFSLGATVSSSTFSVSVYEETETEDVLLITKQLPIHHHASIGENVLLNEQCSLSYESSWKSKDMEEELMKVGVMISIQGVGVSVVNNQPCELLYASINDLSVSFGVFEIGKMFVEVQAQSLQVDNQLPSCKYPVVIGSPVSETPRRWLHVAGIIQPHPSVFYVEYFSLLMNELCVNIESHFLLELISLIRDIPVEIMIQSNQNCLKRLNQNPLFVKPLLIPDLVLNATSIFAEFFELQPVLITLSSKMDPAHPVTGSILPSSPFFIPIQAILDTVGTILGNTDNAQIKLNSFITENLFISQNELVSQLSSHYLKQVLKQLYRILGSVSFLGNPVGLIESLGTGVSEFFYHPIQGLVQGPEEFVGGLGRGTKALLANTSYGVLNTVSKIAGTFGDGVSSLTMNDEYKNNRAAGKSGILYGVKEGVMGVYKDTVNGAKNGVLGAIAGTGKGMIGLVCKPVAGVFDDATRVMESMKEVTQMGVSLHRIRLPRYLYPDGVLTSYCRYLAEGQSILCELKTNSPFMIDEDYLIHIPDNKDNYLFLTTCHIALITGTNSVLWCHAYDYFTYITCEFNCLQFVYNESHFSILVKSASIASHLSVMIEALRNHSVKPIHLSVLIKQIASHYGETLREDDLVVTQQVTLGDGGSTCRSETPRNLLDFIPSSAVIANVHQCSEKVKNTRMTRVYDEYEIEVKCEEESWLVYRRYSEFEFLHKQLIHIKGVVYMKGMKLPPKQVEMLKRFNKKMKDTRIEGLNTYLRILLASPDLLELDCVQSFLKADYIHFSKCSHVCYQQSG